MGFVNINILFAILMCYGKKPIKYTPYICALQMLQLLYFVLIINYYFYSFFPGPILLQIVKVSSFLDYVQGGCQLNFTVSLILLKFLV